MRALRPIHVAQFFRQLKNSSGKMQALRPIHAAQFFMYFSHFSHRLWLALFIFKTKN